MAKAVEIDEKLVYELAKVHCTQAEIAAACNCSIDTLHRRFAEVMARAQSVGKASIKRKFYAKAEAGSVPAMIFFLKTQCGWKERVVHEDPLGNPLAINNVYPSMTKLEAMKILKKRKEEEELNSVQPAN